jgi:Ser/Thr protein kinase RdoA (MazF antagonist)
MEGIMAMQTKPCPRKLTVEEIRLVQRRVAEALLQMGAAEVPDCLNHLDLNPGNVFVDSRKSTFLDWAEATVGNPFFSCEYLRQHFVKTFHAGQETANHFARSYAKRWSSILPGKAIETMPRVVPLTAIYAFAASALPWHDPSLSRRHEVAAYLRSLARRMYRESELLGGQQTA